FTPTQNFDLTEIDVAIGYSAVGGNTPHLDLALYSNSGGQPGGTALATWNDTTTLPVHFTCCDLVSQVFSGISLHGGTGDWIVASPRRIDTTDYWELNSTGQSGTWLDGTCTISGTHCVDQQWTSTAQGAMPAFDVRGVAVPEPPVLLLLAAGLIACVAFRKK